MGLLAAASLSSLMSSMSYLLFGVRVWDPLTYLSVSVMLMVVAAWLPARRAAGVDPSRALRED